jgi:hypothetical protein
LLYYLLICIYTSTYIYTTLVILTIFYVQWFYFCGGELILSQPLGDGVNSDFPVEIGDCSNNNQKPATSVQYKNYIGQNDMKPLGKIGLSYKGCSRFRPVKSSPLSNPPITPDNVNEMKPSREIIFRNKGCSSLRPVNFNRPATYEKPSAFQESNKYITWCKTEFKEFYTTYRESIKLSNYKLESLSIKMAIEENKGRDSWEMLPEDIKLLYREFLRKKIQQMNTKNLK